MLQTIGLSILWLVGTILKATIILSILMAFFRAINVLSNDQYAKHPFYVLLHSIIWVVTACILYRMAVILC